MDNLEEINKCLNEQTCQLKRILYTLKEISAKVITKVNSEIMVNIDTAVTTERNIDIFKEFGISHITHISIIDIGGGFTIGINGHPKIVAGTSVTWENVVIKSIQVIGAGAGTGKLKLGTYQ